MNAIDEIDYAIKNEILFGTYKIIGMAEPYGNKPGVMTKCINCNKEKRVRYSNLKNGYTKPCKCVTGDTTRDKRNYLSYIGTIYQGWEIVDIKPLENSYKNGYATLKCIKCGYIKDVLAYNLLNKIDNAKNILSCSNCTMIERSFNIRKVQEDFKAKYIGIKYKNDEIIDVICENLTLSDKCVIKCNTCGRTREVMISDFINHRDRNITQCECEASGWNKYSKFIGKFALDDEIIKYEYIKSGKGYYRSFLVKCKKCGEERYIENVSAVVNNVQLDKRPKNFGYKICNCNKGTRSENILDRYKQYIGKKIEGTKLTIVDLELKYDNNGKSKVMAITICDCSPDKEHIHWLPAILCGHITSCGCNLIQYMRKQSLYCKDEFIGKIYDDLEVLGVRQTDTGGILWDCKCLMCNKHEELNPKLVIERKWHIGCGCKIQSAFERNNKYTHKNLIGQDFGGGKIIEIMRTSGGVTKWKMECNYCGEEYWAIAANVAIGHTRSCGCIGKSLGERYVEQALKELNIEYRKQVTAPKVFSIMGGPLYFDFVIRYNGKIAVIEYDGEQHYDLKAFTFKKTQEENEEYFWRLQENDKIKNKYCSDNGYKILRIRDGLYHGKYEKIKEIVDKFIKNL